MLRTTSFYTILQGTQTNTDALHASPIGFHNYEKQQKNFKP
jgi:hypothetical protein